MWIVDHTQIKHWHFLTFALGMTSPDSTLQCPSHSCRNPPESTGMAPGSAGILRNPPESAGMGQESTGMGQE